MTACKTETDQGTLSLRRVVLSPTTANVSPGETQQFAAIGQMSDGTTQPIGVAYAATGGTITSAGIYEAGTTPGTYRVIATLSNGTRADTSEVIVTPPGAHNYWTTFSLTEDPISESGRWINGGAIGLNWTNVSSSSGLAIGHQIGASYTDATAVLGGTWGPDQRVTAAVYATNPIDACYQEVEMRLRTVVSPLSITGYEVSYKSSLTASAYLIIVRWNGLLGDFTVLLDTRGTQFGVTTGDVVSATIAGNVITAYKNGVQMGQAVDNTFTSGSPGMGFNLENAAPGCAGTNGNYGFTNFSATDFAVR